MSDDLRSQLNKISASLAGLAGDNVGKESSKGPGPDITDPSVYKTLDDLCTALMNPPHESWKLDEGRVRINMEWVLRTVGEDHFIYDQETHLRRLHPQSKIATHGLVISRGFQLDTNEL